MRSRLAFGLVLLLAVVLAHAPACSNYVEGQQCSVQNGNDDCETGLVCTPAASLNNNGSDICCPPVGATNPACIPGALAGSTSTTTTTTSVGVGGAGGFGEGGAGGGGGAGGAAGGGAKGGGGAMGGGGAGGKGGGGAGGMGGAGGN